MAKKRSSGNSVVSSAKRSEKMSPVVQLGIIFIIIAAMFLFYYVGTMMK